MATGRPQTMRACTASHTVSSGCQGLRSTAIDLARPVSQRLFTEYGLPRIIRTDNGVPFATTALGRLSTLSVWWIRLSASRKWATGSGKRRLKIEDHEGRWVRKKVLPMSPD